MRDKIFALILFAFILHTNAKDRNPCNGEIFSLGCKIFDLVKKNAGDRKAELERRMSSVYQHHDNDTRHIIHLIAENVESLSEEQVAEISLVTKQTEEKLKRLKHLLNEKINETNMAVYNKTNSLLKQFKDDITDLKHIVTKPSSVRTETPGNKKLKNLEDNITKSINKSRSDYEIKFLLTAKYVGEKYANLETKVNSTIKDMHDIMRRIENNTDIYRKGFNEMKRELETHANMSTPATKMEVARVEENVREKYAALTKEVNESIARVEKDLEKAVGKRLTSRESIGAVENDIERLMGRRFASRYSMLRGEVNSNITRVADDLKRTIESDMDTRYDSLKKKVYKNLSVITGSVMRDIVLITQNIRDMWRSARSKGWPEGHYCLYKYGDCPHGFVVRKSHVHKKGIYCCR